MPDTTLRTQPRILFDSLAWCLLTPAIILAALLGRPIAGLLSPDPAVPLLPFTPVGAFTLIGALVISGICLTVRETFADHRR